MNAFEQARLLAQEQSARLTAACAAAAPGSGQRQRGARDGVRECFARQPFLLTASIFS